MIGEGVISKVGCYGDNFFDVIGEDKGEKEVEKMDVVNDIDFEGFVEGFGEFFWLFVFVL